MSVMPRFGSSIVTLHLLGGHTLDRYTKALSNRMMGWQAHEIPKAVGRSSQEVATVSPVIANFLRESYGDPMYS